MACQLRVLAQIAVCFVPFIWSCKTTRPVAGALRDSKSELPASSPVEKIRDLSGFTCSSKLVKVAFFDADSTLRVSKWGGPAANSSSDVLVLPFVAAKIAMLNAQNYLVAIVSNQGGVGLTIKPPGQPPRVLTAEDVAGGLLEIASKISRVAKQQNFEAHIDYIDMAESDDQFRKPASGMAQMLSDTLAGDLKPEYVPRLRDGVFHVNPSCEGAKIDWSQSFMIGDAAYKAAKPSANFPGDPLPQFLSVLPGFDKDPQIPYPRLADDFTNSDRLFAAQLKIAEKGEAPRPVGLAFLEPADFFEWWQYGVGNLLPDAAKPGEKVLQNVTLSDFLKKLEMDVAPKMQQSNLKAAEMILKEVAAVRLVNSEP